MTTPTSRARSATPAVWRPQRSPSGPSSPSACAAAHSTPPVTRRVYPAPSQTSLGWHACEDFLYRFYRFKPGTARGDLTAAVQVAPGPVLDAGIGRVQFLTAVGAPQPRFAPLGSTGGVRRLGHGAIVLLPPSRLTDRHQVTWLQGPHGVALPDPEQLVAALARLPVDPLDLAAWAQARADVA